ncbi:MAG: c-type cytochrome biogenesis protein CcsB [Candidatus Obscuribacterales bacterium]|nr:c-type cytochrome biogenesis protein CcsB [Candidatus Obscuribacterales bacterium]
MSDLQVALTNTAGVSSVVSFWVFVGSNALSKNKDKLIKAAQFVMVIGFSALSAAIVARGFEANRFPLSNLYESLLWFAWAIMGGYLFISRTYDLKQLGWLASLTAAVFFLYGSWLPAGQHEIKPLVPALVSYWRQIHVPPLIVSYAMFFIAGLSAFVQLWQAGRARSVFFSIAALSAGLSAIGLGTFTDTNTFALQALFVGGSLLGLALAWSNIGRVSEKHLNKERAELYDEVVYRSIMIGFPLLTIGIITGGLWANHAWGSYWSWDPKESMALATWLGYAAYIHLRIHRECDAERLSLVAVGGMLLTVLTYLGFNSLGFGGLHSYGKIKD